MLRVSAWEIFKATEGKKYMEKLKILTVEDAKQ